jgi:hypothetical protein
VAFRFLSGDQHPDHATIAEFRKRHLEALSGLFTQALLLCSEAGLVKLGHVSIDGTKIKANARRGPHGQVFVRGVERNFTDPESRIMPDGANKGSFVQGYNAQIAVDAASQVIVAAEVTQETNDKKQLLPMIALIAAHLDQKPEKVSADAGYFSEANVTDQSVKDVDLYLATGRDKHSEVAETSSGPPPADASPKEAMREKLRTEAGRAVYKMRKAIVEPVFGQIKEQRGFRRFSLRGKENVSREWTLVCAVSNLLKLFRAGAVPEMA